MTPKTFCSFVGLTGLQAPTITLLGAGEIFMTLEMFALVNSRSYPAIRTTSAPTDFLSN